MRARHRKSTSTQRGDEASESGGGDTGDACEARDVDAMDLASELCSDRRSVGGRLFTGHAEVTAVNVSNQDARGVHATRGYFFDRRLCCSRRYLRSVGFAGLRHRTLRNMHTPAPVGSSDILTALR